ncbi:hypothetical protein NDU88_003278 [Pleurodeles waltl]|uniref:Uncharacterized protein n=1 Tax=Pleurodeles waltl TaxID=8319 RepID=A0AAV7VCX1_PLEWA|nr:hypothetical protein NDU88_003278 [Pleurodeles waltl]
MALLRPRVGLFLSGGRWPSKSRPRSVSPPVQWPRGLWITPPPDRFFGVTGHCDRPLPSSPSGEETGADSATSNPERDRALSNPLALPGRRRQKRAVCGVRGVVDKEEEPPDGGDNADETGETEAEEETLQLKQAVKEDSLGRREPADPYLRGDPRINSGPGGVL